MVDFTTYQPPGVYVEEVLQPSVSTIGIAPTVVGIVGPSVGYRTTTEAVVVAGTGQHALGQKGINPTTGFSVRAADGTLYDPSTYALTVSAGPDGNITATADNLVSIARNGTTIPDGTTVYVSYRYTDAAYYGVLRTTDYDDIEDAFGPAFDPLNGNLVSPLSLAARIALENGVRNLVLVSTEGSASAVTRAQLVSGYQALDGIYDVNIIVPLPVGITGTTGAPGDTANIGLDLRTYVETSAREGIFRVGILGLESTVTVDPITTLSNYRSRRVMHVHPNRLTYYHGQTNTVLELGGYYLAAANAGRIASQAPQMPLTKKDVRGFAGFPASIQNTLTTSQKNTWSDGGACVTEANRQGALVVRHGTTTDRTSTFTRELSLVRAKDALVQLISDTFEAANLVGGFIDAETPDKIKSVITGVLETALAGDLMVEYSGVKVRQRPGDPQVIEVKFQYKPAYPLNYILVSFAVDTETGETTALDLAA